MEDWMVIHTLKGNSKEYAKYPPQKPKELIRRFVLASTNEGDSAFDECKMTSKMEFLLKKVIESLKEMGYEVNFDIMAADFHDKKIMGHADIEAKTIYIDKETFNLGRRELAMTIIEENEHILSGKGDETRGFQTHLISKFLSYMEDKNALFL